MRIATVKYERTINLGNFENEKISAEGIVNEGECPDQALLELKAFINGEQIKDNQYPLKDGTGTTRVTLDSSRSWMDSFNKNVSAAADLKKYIEANQYVFNYILNKASQQDNKMFYNYVMEIKGRINA